MFVIINHKIIIIIIVSIVDCYYWLLSLLVYVFVCVAGPPGTCPCPWRGPAAGEVRGRPYVHIIM